MGDIVDSLFGPTPMQIQQMRQAQQAAAAQTFAAQTPLQRAAALMYQGGGMLGGVAAESMGMVDPAVQQAQQRQQDLSGIDTTSSASVFQKAATIQDPRLKAQLVAYGQQLQAQESKQALDNAKALAELHKANAEASPIAKLSPKDYTPESWNSFAQSGYKDSGLLRAIDKTPFESMSNEEKLVAAAAKAKGLVEGTPEYQAFTSKAFQQLMDKRTHINVTTTGSQYNLSVEQQDALDKAITEGRLDPGRINSKSAIILANQLIRNPTINMTGATADAKAQISGVTNFTAGTQGNVVTALGVANSHLDLLNQLNTAQANNDTQLLNRVQNVWRTQTGSELPTNPKLAAEVVGKEVVKALGVAGAGSAEERASIADKFANYQSPEQMAGAITTARGLLGGQIQGKARQYQAATGRTDFNTKFGFTPDGNVAKPSVLPKATASGATVSNW